MERLRQKAAALAILLALIASFASFEKISVFVNSKT
jgi:hypothetical protein